MKKKTPEQLRNLAHDSVRALIMAKLEETGFSLKAVSRRIGKNDAYLHQFVWRQSPRVLPEEVRNLLADCLQIPPSMLRARHTLKFENVQNLRPGTHQAGIQLAPSAQSAAVRAGFEQSSSGETTALIPLYSFPGVMHDAAALEWVERPGTYAGGGAAFAIWIPETIGRLRAGDLAFVRISQPPGPGDATVVAQSNEILAIGELIHFAGEMATIRTAAGDEQYKMPLNRLMRIAAVFFR